MRVGDRVRYVGDLTPHRVGKVGTIVKIPHHNSFPDVRVKWDDGDDRIIGIKPGNLEVMGMTIQKRTVYTVNDKAFDTREEALDYIKENLQ